MSSKHFRRNYFRFLKNQSFLASIGAFTLVELLVTSAIIPILVFLVSQLFIIHVSVERKLLASQSTENFRSRLSFILESDIADGRKIIQTPDTAEALICPQESNQIFAVFVPYLDPVNATITDACIIYSISNGMLLRKGPVIEQNGSLDYSTSSTLSVAPGVNISNLSVNSSKTKVLMDLELQGFLGSGSKSFPVSYGTKNLKVGS